MSEQAKFLVCFPWSGLFRHSDIWIEITHQTSLSTSYDFPYQLAVPRHHQSATLREAAKTKQSNNNLFYCNKPGKADPGLFQRRQYSGRANLPVVFATSLLCEVAQLPSSAFPFLANLRCAGPAFRPNLGPGTALEVEPLEMRQTRARPKITAVPAHPARGRRMGPPPAPGSPAS